MFFISKNQYKFIQFYMKWSRFDFKHFCILSGIESIKFKHESCLIPFHSSSSHWRSSIIEYMGLVANFLSKMEHNISTRLRSGLFAGHSNTFSSNFAIFSWTSFDLCQGARSYWNVYADLFGNFPIDCVNCCCRTGSLG